ncbi:molybdopterin-dependent oxidoreductase [Oleidesulfovibrio alaskensis]|uniref:molybdopterin-dependent oxidoreductase n=1 Tax=Oleidesulfovibrio alaskensis TaxID=58180 RepID=UPI001E071B08|nr:molybdopterin-dependent oxidoreductase [Oleidesulfovibrio alaskensis]MBG0772323.1 molybdopterin-dependent oxidoreductase [Oleidesulfovibrio alaskensis]
MTQLITGCTLDCPDCCSMVAVPRQDGTLSIQGNPAHPFTQGLICGKGKNFVQRLQSSERITTPLVRRNGTLRKASWDEALSVCAAKIDALRATPEKMLHIRGAGTRGVLFDAAGELPARLRMAATHGSLCDETGIEACKADFGSLNMNHPHDLFNADRIVNWGRDISRSSVHLAKIVNEARKKGTQVLLISPCPSGAAGYADEVITVRPGTDRFLAAAAARRLLTRPGFRQRLLRCSANADAYLACLDAMDEHALLTACDVSTAALEKLTDWYADTDAAVSTLLGWGLQRYIRGAQNVRHINALAMISGHIGKNGAGVFYNISSSRNFNRQWMQDLPEPSRRLSLPRIGQELAGAAPPVELVLCRGINFVNQCPDSHTTAAALRHAFVIVLDAFMNDTAALADVLLPCSLMLEREEIVGSFMHNQINYCAPVFPPPGECRDDFDILDELGSRLSEPVRLPDRETCLRRALDSPLLQTTLSRLRQEGFATAEHPFIAYEGMRTDHQDGLFHCVAELSPDKEDSGDYPFFLLTLISRNTLHSQIPAGMQQGLPELAAAPCAAQAAGIADGEAALLCTPGGQMQVTVRFDPAIHPSAVRLRRGGWVSRGWGANGLTAPLVTDAGEGAAFYSQKAAIKKLQAEPPHPQA